MRKEHPEHLFLQEKPTLALLAIWSFQKTYASVIAKEINSTFAHTTKILSKMEDAGLVTTSIEGRIKYVELTLHGHQVVDALKNLILVLENRNPDQYNLTDGGSESHIFQAENNGQVINKTFKGKVNHLRLKIENIYKGLLENDVDPETIARKLGPFKRDLQILEQQMDTADNIDEIDRLSLIDAKNRLEEMIRKDNN
ncbi:regulatory protein MarR [Methanosalsum zhilinae DSM 4017]|uniref:Regulatory protein MarR n=1 Tax=Methanosalsum zhilinae (strain DSM 4017 / NBRC 107636 / OCM 62 / WeN5) TaxID=679901 RepID=F7XND9_METZD|nr:winged helix-turn-helix domain-containing protein [Methanosalsum zhilinae]AEH61189.1 regulatory protein MarR [Methanosalsum zhilinae DSM 4017]